MATTTYDGVIKDGRVTVAPGTTLPDRARVYVVVPDPASIPVAEPPSASQGEEVVRRLLGSGTTGVTFDEIAATTRSDV